MGFVNLHAYAISADPYNRRATKFLRVTLVIGTRAKLDCIEMQCTRKPEYGPNRDTHKTECQTRDTRKTRTRKSWYARNPGTRAKPGCVEI